jgi:predicted lysophospholipase L1 biosynthesis ABC-type transport system permease subunit
VIGNDDALTTAIATVSPGSARTNELWLDVARSDRERVATALDRRPYRALDVQSRDAVEADARRDPLGHGTLVALGASAFVALLLAVIGLALSVRSDLRDERGELVDLEALGASPILLRRAVRLRAAIILTGGVAGGVVAGVALAALVTRVIGVTARAGTAEPPLATSTDPRSIVVAGVLLLLAAVVAVVAVTRAAFSDPRGPGRVGGSG